MTGFEHLLVATDLSDEALPGIDAAAALARRLDARVTLVFVVDDHLPPLYDALPDADRQRLLDEHERRARSSLEGLASGRFAGLDLDLAILVGTPHEEIVRAAVTTGADLVVMGTHGYGRVASMVFGSTAERVLRHAPCPVVLVRADAGAP
ncbi:MAG: universal stress protein [Thermoanaerobaculia bacterium]|nr:universal stress protein [Thermoanaerobaculia bacterium]